MSTVSEHSYHGHTMDCHQNKSNYKTNKEFELNERDDCIVGTRPGIFHKSQVKVK